MNYKPMPEIGILNSLFELDANRGVLIRKRTHTNHKAGEVCGSKMKSGHLQTCVETKRYLVHRIIYFMKTGVDPLNNIIDHKDGNPSNNNIDNLRLATKAENGQHKVKLCSMNKSGYRNVSWSNSWKCWLVSITVNGKRMQKQCSDLATAVSEAARLRTMHYGEFAGLTT